MFSWRAFSFYEDFRFWRNVFGKNHNVDHELFDLLTKPFTLCSMYVQWYVFSRRTRDITMIFL